MRAFALFEVKGIVINMTIDDNCNDLFQCLIVRELDVGTTLIEKSMQSKNSIEFLAIWESISILVLNSPNSRE